MHGSGTVARHDPSGTEIDIVSEDFGACPGPASVLRLRSASKDRTIEAVVSRRVTANGASTVTTETHVVAPLKSVELGCAAKANPSGGRPASVTDWSIVSSAYR